jgi:vitamin B12 transporter
VHFKISDTQQLSTEGMYTYNFREIQPAVTNDDANETLCDQHIRLSLNYQNFSRAGILSATVGYILSDQDYTDDNVSTVRSTQLTALVSMDKTINLKTNLRYGVSYSNFSASAENYISNISENRYDGFISFRYALHPYWLININLRQSLYANHYAPLAPTLGTEIQVLHAEKNKLVFRAQAARGFRVPTLNDRYWVPGGNPAVGPEDAFHIEGGGNWTRTINALHYTIDLAAYQSWIDDMIVWIPQENVWSPTNLQQVNLRGVELNTTAVFTRGKYQFRGKLMYSYTSSVNKTGQNGFDNKQLAYVPLHSGRASASVRLSQWEFDMRLNVTSVRYISLDNERSQALDPYGLLDASLSKEFLVQRITFQTRADVFNLFNIYYENLKNHAMPGRHYAISISVKLNNKQTL